MRGGWWKRRPGFCVCELYRRAPSVAVAFYLYHARKSLLRFHTFHRRFRYMAICLYLCMKHLGIIYLMASPIILNSMPGLHTAIALSSASLVLSMSSIPTASTLPIGKVAEVSPWNLSTSLVRKIATIVTGMSYPSKKTVTSTLTISPSLSGRLFKCTL